MLTGSSGLKEGENQEYFALIMKLHNYKEEGERGECQIGSSIYVTSGYIRPVKYRMIYYNG